MKISIARIGISAVAIVGLILNWKLRDGKDFSNTDLIFIGIALLPWVGDFVDSVTWGKDREIKFNDRLERVELKAAAALDAGIHGVAKGAMLRGLPPAGTSTATAVKATDNDDPQKGNWGSTPAANGRQLSAKIEKIPGEDFFRRLILTVRSIDPSRPLYGTVTFHLHPSLSRPDLDVPVVDGFAETSLVSYGAFTIGAEADGGNTRLELDLTSLDDNRDQFFKR